MRRIGGWKSLLVQFFMLEEVPYEQEEVWVEAWSEVTRRLQAAEIEEDTDTALMWLMFLPQALLRKPTRGQGAHCGQVTKRFHAVQRGDWGYLVERWEDDLARLEKIRAEGSVCRQETEVEKEVRIGREA